jgi:Cof subfamily protein (haloacid dehalogenase superfamily)
MIKLICSDIDGTLLNAERELSALTISEINKLDLPVVLISSRMPSAMRYLQNQLNIEDQPIVAYNGGLILVQGEIKKSSTIPFELVSEICQLNADGLHLSLYNNDDWFAPENDRWTDREMHNTKVSPVLKSNIEVLNLWREQEIGAHKIMCMGKPSLVDKFYKLLDNQLSVDVHLYRSKDTYIEIAPKTISKRSAIEFLTTKVFDIELSNVMSFGDNYNDIEMLSSTGLGLAVGNAKAEVKDVADQIIGNAKEDGVAKFLSRYFKLR